MYYREESPGSALEAKWADSVADAMRTLLQMPERGSRCHFRSPGLRGMRWIPIPGFPRHQLFYVYVAAKRVVRVVDVVHSARDVEVLFSSTPR